jgi:hypothetical protein
VLTCDPQATRRIQSSDWDDCSRETRSFLAKFEERRVRPREQEALPCGRFIMRREGTARAG